MTGFFSDPILFINAGIIVTALLVIFMDWRYYRIPNALIIINILFAFAWQFFTFSDWYILIEIIVSIVLLVIIFYLLLMNIPKGIGGGDIKYALTLTLYFGPIFFLVLWLASITGLAHRLLLSSIGGSKKVIPFAVHLGLWTIIEVVFRLEILFYDSFAFGIY